jgi:LysR family nitrogen assimilation transcriptional regulator
LELRQFKYFLSIADSGSLSRAALQLHVAQSALSRQLSELEAELGTQLLLRSRNGVVLTDSGKVFYEYAQGITKQIEDARAAVHCAADAVVGSVLRAAAKRYPNIVFHLNEELTGNMADQMLRGRVDVAVFTPGMLPQDIAFTPLVDEAFVLIHSSQDEGAPPPGDVTVAQAIARPLVLPSNHHGHCTRWIVDAALEAGSYRAQRIAAEINSVYVLKSAVEAGIGPTIMPLGLAQREVEDGRLVAHAIASDAMVRRLGLCVSRHLPMTNAKRAICQLIRDVVRELCEQQKWAGARLVTEG